MQNIDKHLMNWYKPIIFILFLIALNASVFHFYNDRVRTSIIGNSFSFVPHADIEVRETCRYVSPIQCDDDPKTDKPPRDAWKINFKFIKVFKEIFVWWLPLIVLIGWKRIFHPDLR